MGKGLLPIIMYTYIHTILSYLFEWLLLEMTQSYPTDVKIHVMYDIACTLKKHMEVSNMIFDTMSVLCIIFKRTGCEEVLGRVEFALPSVHAYGHKPQCQVSTAQLTWKCIHMLYI